jgi:hypothetical protein
VEVNNDPLSTDSIWYTPGCSPTDKQIFDEFQRGKSDVERIDDTRATLFVVPPATIVGKAADAQSFRSFQHWHLDPGNRSSALNSNLVDQESGRT